MAAKPRPLTARQAEIALLVSRGLQRKTIAHDLGITVSTVDKHLAAIRDNTQTRTTVEAVVAVTGQASDLHSANHDSDSQWSNRPTRPDMDAISAHPWLVTLNQGLQTCASFNCAWVLTKDALAQRGGTQAVLWAASQIQSVARRSSKFLASTLPPETQVYFLSLPPEISRSIGGDRRVREIFVMDLDRDLGPNLTAPDQALLRDHVTALKAIGGSRYAIFPLALSPALLSIDLAVAFGAIGRKNLHTHIAEIGAEIMLAGQLLFWRMRDRGLFRARFSLTNPEREILRLSAAGCDLAETSSEMATTETQAKETIASACEKLTASNALQAYSTAEFLNLL